MYGWRAKIGLITPMSENAEHAFHIYAPEGVSVASTKIPAPEGVNFAGLVENAASLYYGNEYDLVVFGGDDWGQICPSCIEKASGIPGLTTATAVLEALQTLGTRKVAVLTPYGDETNQVEKKFLEDHGFEVTNILGMDMSSFSEGDERAFSQADEYFLYQHSIRVDLKGADTFFLSSMSLTTMEIIGHLETYLGTPVVTSHQATLWGALRHCRVGAKLPKMGRLFTL